MPFAATSSRRLRWTATVASAAALLVLASSAVLYDRLKSHLKREVDGDLRRIHAQAVEVLARGNGEAETSAALEALVGTSGAPFSVEVLGTGLRAGHLKANPGTVAWAHASADPSDLPSVGLGHPFRGMVREAVWQGRPVRILTTLYLKTYLRRLRHHQVLVAVVTAGAWVAAFALAWWASGRLFGPLEEAYRRESAFAADVAHELRTPLTRIQGEVEVALGSPRTPEAYREVLASVQEEVRRLSGLVGHLLALARAEAGQEPLAFAPVDLALLFAELEEAYRPLAEEKGLGFEVSVPPGLRIRGDRLRLRQALANLLDNAMRLTASGHVALSARRDSEGAVLEVRDTGPGIPVEHQARLFERFYRVPGSPPGEGTGLGLALVAWVARAHGGRVLVESRPGAGSAFSLRVPG